MCGTNPATEAMDYLLVRTEPLPDADVPPSASEVSKTKGWLVRLADATICSFATGATGGVDDERANYVCTDQLGPRGSGARRTLDGGGCDDLDW